MAMGIKSRPYRGPLLPPVPLDPRDKRIMLIVMFAMAALLGGCITLLIWDMNTRICLRSAPGTCYTSHVPVHRGAHPCDVCVEWGRK